MNPRRTHVLIACLPASFVLQLAFSQPWSTTLIAVLGLSAGALYRSDIANLKSYRLPSWFIRLSSRYLLSLVGESRAVRRTNRALPATDLSETAPRLEDDDVVTTAHTPRAVGTDRLATGSREAAEQPGPSVMREWVNELTGRVDRASTGIRVPTEDEISQLMGIFPDMQRDVIVAALQRRWVPSRFWGFAAITIGAVPISKEQQRPFSVLHKRDQCGAYPWQRTVTGSVHLKAVYA